MEQQPSARANAQSLANQAFLSNEDACAALFEQTPGGILHWAAGGVILAANPAFGALVHRPAGELVGRSLQEFIHPDDWPKAQELARELLALPGASRSCEPRFWRKDGGYTRVELRFSAVPGRDGQPASLLGMAREVAGQSPNAELGRIQNAALDATDNSIMITDAAGTVIYVNRAFTELTGYPAAEALGKNPRFLNSGRHDPAYFQRLWATVASGRPWHSEVVNRRKDGSFYTQEQWISPVCDPGGKITHFIAIQQDVTRRKRLETELQQSRDRFLKVFRANPVAIGICFQSGNGYTDVNDSLLKLLEYSRAEIIGQSAYSLGLWVKPEQRDRLVAALKKDGSVINLEVQLKTKSGKVLDVLASVEPIQLGLEACWLFIDVDITARKSLEAQLRQAAKMEAVGTLAGGVAHDFNNLLTVIRGHTEMLAAAELSPDSLESVGQIAEAADRATHLTRQLLTFSRTQRFQPRPLDLNEVLLQLSKMLRRIIGEDITLEIITAPGLPPVLADAGMVEQIVFNLAANARDAMAGGGRLVIATDYPVLPGQPVAGRPSNPTGFLRVSVQDNGCGIPPELQAQIFEPFFTTKGVGKGTGLGLATVHSIVEQHGGWIELQSQPGRSTTFLIYLPAGSHHPTAAAPGELPLVPVPKGEETIFLVEDEETVRKLAVDILRLYGYQVISAGSGPEAVMIWAQQKDRIDVMLTDMVMPGGMSGIALAQRLREDRPDLKVLFSSGYVNTGMFLDALSPPDRQHFLQKPYSPTQLAQAIRDVLDEQPGAKP